MGSLEHRNGKPCVNPTRLDVAAHLRRTRNKLRENSLHLDIRKRNNRVRAGMRAKFGTQADLA